MQVLQRGRRASQWVTWYQKGQKRWPAWLSWLRSHREARTQPRQRVCLQRWIFTTFSREFAGRAPSNHHAADREGLGKSWQILQRESRPTEKHRKLPTTAESTPASQRSQWIKRCNHGKDRSYSQHDERGASRQPLPTSDHTEAVRVAWWSQCWDLPALARERRSPGEAHSPGGVHRKGLAGRGAEAG